MNSILDKIKGEIIISTQAMTNEPFYNEIAMKAMMQSVLDGGAKGLRVAGERDIKIAKNLTTMPAIGITKPDTMPAKPEEEVYITPTIKDVQTVIDAGADIIAFDATMRPRPDNKELKETIELIKKHDKLSMADVSTFKEGLNARKLGADVISTTLSGYTSYSKKIDEPDFELLKGLKENLDCPIILEGRIWRPEQVQKAFEIGAWSVVIGSAVTRPHLIVKNLKGA